MGRKRKRRYKMAIAAAAAAGVFFCLFLPKAAAAFWSPEKAVHINGDEIENSTLVIGTHLIHLSALTEELFQVAEKSAEDSMQRKTYYKSELAGGTWFDITSASKLEDISTGGTPVTVEEINSLYMEYHTRSDGVTYDLRTGSPVNIFDIRDPYDLEAMEELQPLKLQLDMLMEKESLSDEEQWCGDQILKLLKTEVTKASAETVEEDTGEITVYSGADTEELDRSLEFLQNYLSVLNEYGGDSGAKDEVNEVMESVDATRRLIVCEIMYDATYKLMETYTGSNGKLPEGYKVDAALTDAANESVSNLNESIIETQGKIRGEGDTVLSMEIYRWTLRLTEDARAENMAACDVDVENLLALKRILDGTVDKQEAELKLLEESLLTAAKDRYLQGLGKGENSEYLTARAGNAARVMLDSIAPTYGNRLNMFRNELEFLVEAKCMRLDNGSAQNYIQECISEAAGFYGKIPSDGFYEVCRDSVDAYVEWLNGKLYNLVQGGGGTEADVLQGEKEELQEQYMAALDRGDLDKAQEIKGKIDALDGELKALSSEQAQEYAGLEAEIESLKKELENAVAGGGQGAEELERQIAGKQAQAAEIKARMSGESVGAQAVKIKQEAMKAVTENPGEAELNQIGNAVEALGAMLDSDYKAAFPPLTQLYSEMTRERDLNGTEAYDDIIEKVEELILNNKAAYDAAMEKKLSAEKLEESAGIFFGAEDSAGWTQQQIAVFLAAGEMYLENAMGKRGGAGEGAGAAGLSEKTGDEGRGQGTEPGRQEESSGFSGQAGDKNGGPAGESGAGGQRKPQTQGAEPGGKGGPAGTGSPEAATGDGGKESSSGGRLSSGTGTGGQAGESGTGSQAGGTGAESQAGEPGAENQAGEPGAGSQAGESGAGGQTGEPGAGGQETKSDTEDREPGSNETESKGSGGRPAESEAAGQGQDNTSGQNGQEVDGEDGKQPGESSGDGRTESPKAGGEDEGQGGSNGAAPQGQTGRPGNVETGNQTGGAGFGKSALEGELKAVADMLEAKAEDAYLTGNPLVFFKLSDPAARYVPVPAVGRQLRMRYLWNASKNQATLALGSRYYEFTLFSNQVKTGKSEAEVITIPNAPKIRSVLYMPEEFALSEFGCGAMYLENSEYAVLYTGEIKDQAEELLEILMEDI